MFARVWVLAGAVWAAGAGWAAAQAPMPPLEIGVGLSGVLTTPYEDFLSDVAVPTVAARVTIPVSPRFSFDAAVDVGRERTSEHSTRLDALYSFQIKQRLESTTRDSFHAFLTYGVAGYYERRTQEEVRATLPDGEISVTPAFRVSEWEGPAATLFGGGVQFGLSRRAAVRVEAQMVSFIVIPMGVRLAASLSIPIGGR
jgi:hypothetical protein